jgi:hypothetical protein
LPLEVLLDQGEAPELNRLSNCDGVANLTSSSLLELDERSRCRLEGG